MPFTRIFTILPCRYVDLNCLKPNSIDYNYSEADERLILNCGAIGLPFDKPTHLYKERRAEYLLLEIGENGDINPHFRRVTYNISLVFKRANKYQLPFKDKYVNSFEIYYLLCKMLKVISKEYLKW